MNTLFLSARCLFVELFNQWKTSALGGCRRSVHCGRLAMGGRHHRCFGNRVGRTNLSCVVSPELRDRVRLGWCQTSEVLVRGWKYPRGKESSDHQNSRRKEDVKDANDALHCFRISKRRSSSRFSSNEAFGYRSNELRFPCRTIGPIRVA